MAREVLSNGVINPDKYQADWYADLSNNWNLLNNLIGSAISGSEVDSKIATAIQELMIRTFQIVAELPATGTEGVMYLVLIPNTSKYTAYVWENSAYRELGVIQMTITIDDELSTTSENPAQNKVITNALNNKAPISHTHTASDITSGLATVATSGSYNDLSNKPTIPTVNNATLTIQQNGTNVQTFTANASTNATANITVPTKTSDLTNDSGFITSDTTKIPLTGTSALAGSIIPNTDNAYNLGDSTYGFASFYVNKLYLKGSTIFNVVDDNYICVGGATAQANGANLVLNGKNRSTSTGEFKLEASDGTYTRQLIGKPDGTLSWSGNIIPSANDTYNLGSSSYSFQYVNARIIRQNNLSDSLFLIGAPGWNEGASISLFGKNNTTLGGGFRLDAHNGTDFKRLEGSASGTLSWSGTSIVPTSDGTCNLGSSTKAFNIIYGKGISQSVTNNLIAIDGGTDYTNGAELVLYGKDSNWANAFRLFTYDSTNTTRYQFQGMGSTLTWNGTAIQYTSDARLKQQITQIDDDLLTAWEDVNPVQFKYNDAVKEKSDNARLHTGYVVQQIDEACKSHNVDISKYGLYCHEEYAEETREVEREDGTKTTEVVRPASEHYSLRYTEALIVECAYLRKKLKELTARIEQLEKGNNVK